MSFPDIRDEPIWNPETETVDWVKFQEKILSKEETVAGMRRMIERTRRGLCASDDCDDPPTENGIWNSARDKVIVRVCKRHYVDLQVVHGVPVVYEGEMQRG
jgi:hypothetical protein